MSKHMTTGISLLPGDVQDINLIQGHFASRGRPLGRSGCIRVAVSQLARNIRAERASMGASAS
jgi:hypothetical protein